MACAAVLLLSGQNRLPASYAEGQVWEYRTRAQDAGSLLKIQKVEPHGDDKVYHLSIIGVRFTTPGIAGILPHTPVSRLALDRSVTRRSSSQAAFPTTAVDDGIAEWRRAKGGIYTIPVSEILRMTDEMLGRRAPQNQPSAGA